MVSPVDVLDLINGRRVEGPRTEYEKGWDPERVLHTMCAFANDIENWGGGYIIIGVDYIDGIPRIEGIDSGSVDAMSRELLSMGNLMEPRYVPVAEALQVDGRTVYLIWVPAGDRRPYSCPVHYSRNNPQVERGYYIRRLSSTIRANRDDERTLFDVSRAQPFDECINYDATFDDIRPSIVREYLQRIGSSLYRTSLDVTPEELALSMRLAGGPREDLRPLNVAMMFFNKSPHTFLPGAYIEVVRKPDPTGEGMIVNRFDGPLDGQILRAMDFLRNVVIAEMIRKTDSATSERHYNYPPRAVRELLVNAVYHKSYEINEPVVVTVYDDRIEFLNYPGPSPSISDDDLRNNRLHVGIYRNRRTGEYLRELDMAEARFTGIPNVIRQLESNGSPPLRIDTDPGRTYFLATLPVHPWFLETSDGGEGLSLDERIVMTLELRGCLSMRELSEALGYSGVSRRVSSEVSRMMSEGLVEYLHPDKPRSPKQRICLPGRGDGRPPARSPRITWTDPSRDVPSWGSGGPCHRERHRTAMGRFSPVMAPPPIEMGVIHPFTTYPML